MYAGELHAHDVAEKSLKSFSTTKTYKNGDSTRIYGDN
jgi:hypothetical protein